MPLFTLLGLALGFTAGLYSLYSELFKKRGGDGESGRRRGKDPGNDGTTD